MHARASPQMVATPIVCLCLLVLAPPTTPTHPNTRKAKRPTFVRSSDLFRSHPSACASAAGRPSRPIGGSQRIHACWSFAGLMRAFAKSACAPHHHVACAIDHVQKSAGECKRRDNTLIELLVPAHQHVVLERVLDVRLEHPPHVLCSDGSLVHEATPR